MLMLMFFEPELFIWCDMFVCLCVHVMPIPAGSRQMNLILSYIRTNDALGTALLYPVERLSSFRGSHLNQLKY